MNLTDIAKTWEGYQKLDPGIRRLVDSRLQLCDSCPNKRQLGADGSLRSTPENGPESVYYCGMCGCPLLGKTSNAKSVCPINRWTAALEEASYY